MKIIINKCYGGYGLSDVAYEALGKLGVPIQKYIEQECDPITHLYLPEPRNEGEVIFDRELTPPEPDGTGLSALYHKYKGTASRPNQRYWETWSNGQRSHPLVLQVVEALGKKANGPFAQLAIVEIPDGTDFEISEYDGLEHVAEVHRTWS